VALTLGAMFFEGASPCCGYDGADEAEVVVSGQDRGSEALTDECGSSEEEETHTKAEALTDIVLERLVNRLNGRSGDLSGPLCSLIALLPEEAAVGELLKLSTLKQDPYKAELQIALQQAGAVVALLAAAVRGSEDVQRLAKLALSAIAINSGNAPMSAETVPPSPLGLTPNITPLNTPLATPAVTPLQGHLVAHNDCLDPLAMLMQGGGGFAQPMSRSRSSSSEPVRRLPGGSRTSSCEPIRRPSDSREPSERSLSSCQERVESFGDGSSESTCETREPIASDQPQSTKRPKSPGSWPISPGGWTSSSYHRGTLSLKALKKAMNKWGGSGGGSREHLEEQQSARVGGS